MIKNERQYRITRSQFEKFQTGLKHLESEQGDLARLHMSAHLAMAEELQAQIAEYESLRSGETKIIVADELRDLPRSLIKARIARQMTHRELAERIGVKEQQIQRWESEDYRAASLDNLRSVADALGLQASTDLYLPVSDREIALCRKRLEAAGVRESLFYKILSPPAFAALWGNSQNIQSFVHALRELSKVLGLTVENLLKADPLPALASPAKFKTSANAETKAVNAYAVYAHYVAGVIAAALPVRCLEPLPSSWADMRDLIIENYGDITYSNTLRQIWRCGVIVIPMPNSGSFHGAVWKIKGTFVIVLKQTTDRPARWLFDMLHELAHVILGHVAEDRAIIESHAIENKVTDPGDDEELAANEWARNVLFGGRDQEIEQACIEACDGNLRLLSSALPSVATRYGMDVGILANHMAWRLSAQGENWWGPAQNLQRNESAPLPEAAHELCSRLNFSIMSPTDRALILRAISER